MDTSDLLKRAIQKARSGHELTARELFLEVVRQDPGSEVAWMWLAGLLDLLDDRIMACEQVLSINPGNKRARSYLGRLLQERESTLAARKSGAEDEYLRARILKEKGEHNRALAIVQRVLRESSDHEGAWLLFGELSERIDDKVRAYEQVVRLNPDNAVARESLKRYRYFQDHPADLAAYYEEEGNRQQALDIYRQLAARASSSSEFDAWFRDVERLENISKDNIRHVRPALTIARFSAGIPLLFILLVLLQVGLNPFSNPAPLLWLNIPLVVLGSYLVAVSGVRSHHVIWRKFFGEAAGNGSRVARGMVGATGWFAILVPHLLLFLDSWARLQDFAIPPLP